MVRRNHYRIGAGLLIAVCFTSAGCHVTAPLHVWEPPSLQSTVGQSVLVPKIIGPQDTASSLRQRLVQAVPRDVGRETQLISSEQLARDSDQSKNPVALVAYSPESESDLALSKAAQEKHIQFILQGEILADRRPNQIATNQDRLAVSWRLLPVASQPEKSSGPVGEPVVVELESAIKKYPDLAFIPDQSAALQTALIRETLPLITPSIERYPVTLETPYLVPGSKSVRKGNALAVAGLWAQAETMWKKALERNPFSSVATHNLAIAAVAKQDFSEARRLARKAVRMKPSKLHQQTAVWVEQTQRAYHEAFGLPDPPEGWLVTRSAGPSDVSREK